MQTFLYEMLGKNGFSGDPVSIAQHSKADPNFIRSHSMQEVQKQFGKSDKEYESRAQSVTAQIDVIKAMKKILHWVNLVLVLSIH